MPSNAVSPETLNYLAKKAAKAYLLDNAPLDGTIAKMASEHGLNPHHVRRLCEQANLSVHGTLYKSAEANGHRNIHFDIARPEKIQAMLSGVGVEKVAEDASAYSMPPTRRTYVRGGMDKTAAGPIAFFRRKGMELGDYVAENVLRKGMREGAQDAADSTLAKVRKGLLIAGGAAAAAATAGGVGYGIYRHKKNKAAADAVDAAQAADEAYGPISDEEKYASVAEQQVALRDRERKAAMANSLAKTAEERSRANYMQVDIAFADLVKQASEFLREGVPFDKVGAVIMGARGDVPEVPAILAKLAKVLYQQGKLASADVSKAAAMLADPALVSERIPVGQTINGNLTILKTIDVLTASAREGQQLADVAHELRLHGIPVTSWMRPGNGVRAMEI